MQLCENNKCKIINSEVLLSKICKIRLKKVNDFLSSLFNSEIIMLCKQFSLNLSIQKLECAFHNAYLWFKDGDASLKITQYR